MSDLDDEELKAVEELKEFISPDTEIKAISMENIKIIYNLIEKQQKEIEEYENKLNEVYTGWKNNIERNMRITDGAFNLERK